MIEMFKQKPFAFSLIVGIVLITLHYVGSYYSWYWAYPWYDVIVHVVGGLWVALLVLWVANIFGQVNSLKEYKVKIFLMAFISAVLFGIVWELVENYTKITAVDYSGYSLDTALDILSGAFGGVLAHTYFVRRRKCVDNTSDVLHPFYNQTGLITR